MIYTLNMLKEHNFTIVDVETTGGSPFFSRVIEVGLLRVERGEVKEEYQTLLNPGMEIPEFITNMTGITDRDVASAPAFADIAEELMAKFEDSIFVAHNAQFDYGFLQEEFRRLGWLFNTDRLCTVRLSRALYKQHKHHNLSALIERFEFEIQNRHRAFDDAKVLWDFLQHIHTELDRTLVEKTMRKVLTKSRLKARAKKQAADSTLNSDLVYEDDTGKTFSLS
jgi:DNA polymerase III subunit epsilon